MRTACAIAAKKKVTSRRSRTGATPSFTAKARDVTDDPNVALVSRAASIAARGSGNSCRTSQPSMRRQAPFDRLDQLRADISAKLLVELADAGGARNVDFRDISSYDVQPHEQHARLRKLGADLTGEPAVAFVQGPADATRTGGEITAMIRWQRNARQRVIHRLALDEQNSRVARCHDLRQVTLHD